MPIILQHNGKPRLSKLQERITRMTVEELAEYEATLWRWMDKLKFKSEDVVNQLNAVHREVEWRAEDKDWRDAAHPRQRPRAVAQRTGR
jgi:hypothetical protein